MEGLPVDPDTPDWIPGGPAGSFERTARARMEAHYGKPLPAAIRPPIPTKLDFVSEDGLVVGDAKFFTLVGGARDPPAKLSNIAHYCWLLEKHPAPTKFMVFGNDIRVPQKFLARYGPLVGAIEFWFLDGDRLQRLN